MCKFGTQTCMPTKICALCGEEKLFAEFGKNRSRCDGLTHYCKECHRITVKEGRMRRLGTALTLPSKPKGRRVFRRSFKEDSRRKFHSTILRKYGVRPTDFAQLLIAQSGRCAGCAEALTRPDIDHCATTGRVRGLLCHWCNLAIGLAKEECATLRRLAAYLEANAATAEVVPL